MESYKDFIIGDGWKPASNLLETELPEWFYQEAVFPTDKKKQIYLDGNTFNLSVQSHACFFRWIMPRKPNIYNYDWEVPHEYRMASVLRFTIGEWFGLTADDLNEIKNGRDALSKEKISQISNMLERSFLFNGLKIPYVEVRSDWISDKEFQRFLDFNMNSGKKLAEQANSIVENLKQSQSLKKRELIRSASDTLSSKPNFLSILRDVVSEKISIEDAIEITGNSGVFQKGV